MLVYVVVVIVIANNTLSLSLSLSLRVHVCVCVCVSECTYVYHVYPPCMCVEQLEAYYNLRATQVPDVMKVTEEMEESNVHNTRTMKAKSAVKDEDYAGNYEDTGCRSECQAKRRLQVVRMSENVQAGKGKKRVVLILCGEHAREVISDEVCLFLVQLFSGDIDAIETHTGTNLWHEMLKFAYKASQSNGGSSAIRMAALNVTPEPSVTGKVKNFADEHYKVDDISEVKNAVLEWARELIKTTYIIVVPNMLREGRERAEQGEMCLRTTEDMGDLNRDWSFGWKNDQDGSTFNEPFKAWMNRIVSKLESRESPHVFVNIHSGEFAFYHPWDHMPTAPNTLPEGFSDTVARMADVCDCNHGVAAVMSGYPAYGAAIDYAYGDAKIPYVFTVEVFGPNERGRYGKTLHEAENMKPRHLDPQKFCFWDFNPMSMEEYSDTLAMWGMVLLVLIQDVVDAKNPAQIPRRGSSSPISAATTAGAAVQGELMTTSSLAHTVHTLSSSSNQTVYFYLIVAAALASFVVYFALTTKSGRSARVTRRDAMNKRSMHV